MVDSAELEVTTSKLATNSANAKDGDAAAISKGDVEVQMGNRPIGSKIRTIVPKVTGGAGVNAAKWAR